MADKSKTKNTKIDKEAAKGTYDDAYEAQDGEIADEELENVAGGVGFSRVSNSLRGGKLRNAATSPLSPNRDNGLNPRIDRLFDRGGTGSGN